MPEAHRGSKDSEPPDLQTQLEAILDQVWRCEAEWRLDNRIELAVRRHRPRHTED